ncbi:F-box protein [Streptomyces sp. NPDC057910]|uniref:F-box protein n=1 Tax=Streptomyces sp. NPDC057910 TaxID=3346278 RepID=UPI0036EC3AA4
MTTGPEDSAGLNDQAQEVWAIVAPALQDGDSEPGLPARAHQALQTWPTHNLPHDLWQEILALLPLEDQTRLAHTSHPIQDILEQLAPQALDPTAHTTPDFIRTIYTQTELDTSLNTWRWVEFIPGTDSDLTIGRGLAHAHGPGTLTAVNAGHVTALDDIHITTIIDGTVRAYDRATIEEVTGGTVTARDQTTITAITGGTIEATDNATITATGGDAHIVARGNAHVIIEASAGGVRVDAYDAAHITADNGTITLHSPDVTVTSNSDGNAVINHA